MWWGEKSGDVGDKRWRRSMEKTSEVDCIVIDWISISARFR